MPARVTVGRTRILVVEDDDELRRFICEALEDDGFECIPAAAGQIGLAAAERDAPDLIILNLGLPDMDGSDFAAAYGKAPGVRAPIIVSTARPGARLRDGLEAAAYVYRPFEVAEFLALVRAVLRSN